MLSRDIRHPPRPLDLRQCRDLDIPAICRYLPADRGPGCGVTTTVSSPTTRFPPSPCPATTCPCSLLPPPTPSSLPVSTLLVWYLRIFRLVTCPASPSTWRPVYAPGLRYRWRTTTITSSNNNNSLLTTTFFLLTCSRSWQDPVPTCRILMMSKYHFIFSWCLRSVITLLDFKETYNIFTLNLKIGQCAIWLRILKIFSLSVSRLEKICIIQEDLWCLQNTIKRVSSIM